MFLYFNNHIVIIWFYDDAVIDSYSYFSSSYYYYSIIITMPCAKRCRLTPKQQGETLSPEAETVLVSYILFLQLRQLFKQGGGRLHRIGEK